MNAVHDILARARQHQLTLTAREGRLDLKAPVAPPDDLLEAIRAHKPELLQALQAVHNSEADNHPAWRGRSPESGLPRLPVGVRQPLELAVEGTGWTVEALHGELSPEDLADLRVGRIPIPDLRAFIHAIDTRRLREAGRIPPAYKHHGYCERCGPVWLWTTGRFRGCPWCHVRRTGKTIPRPPKSA